MATSFKNAANSDRISSWAEDSEVQLLTKCFISMRKFGWTITVLISPILKHQKNEKFTTKINKITSIKRRKWSLYLKHFHLKNKASKYMLYALSLHTKLFKLNHTRWTYSGNSSVHYHLLILISCLCRLKKPPRDGYLIRTAVIFSLFTCFIQSTNFLWRHWSHRFCQIWD